MTRSVYLFSERLKVHVMKVKDSKYSLSYRIVNTDWGSVINQCRWNKGNITGSLLSATGSGELSITDSLALVASVTDLVTPRPGRLRFLAYSAVNWHCLLKSAVESILSNLWCSLWAPLSLSIWSITEYWIQIICLHTRYRWVVCPGQLRILLEPTGRSSWLRLPENEICWGLQVCGSVHQNQLSLWSTLVENWVRGR